MSFDIRRAVWVAVLVLTVSACGSEVSSANFDKIETDMSRAEVVAILGEPDSIDSMELGDFSGSAAVWRGGGHEINVTFINGKVAFKSFTEARE